MFNQIIFSNKRQSLIRFLIANTRPATLIYLLLPAVLILNGHFLVWLVSGFFFSIAVIHLFSQVRIFFSYTSCKKIRDGQSITIQSISDENCQVKFKKPSNTENIENAKVCLWIFPVKSKNRIGLFKIAFTYITLIFILVFLTSQVVNNKIGLLVPNIFRIGKYTEDLIKYVDTVNYFNYVGTYLDDYRVQNGLTPRDITSITPEIQEFITKNAFYLPETELRSYEDNIIMLISKRDDFLFNRRLVLYSKGHPKYSIYENNERNTKTEVIKSIFINKALEHIRNGCVISIDSTIINLYEPLSEYEQKKINNLKGMLNSNEILPEIYIYKDSNMKRLLLSFEINRVRLESRSRIKSHLSKEFPECAKHSNFIEVLDCCLSTLNHDN